MRFPAVFLDKDGTLVDNVPDNVDPDRVTLAAGASAGLWRLHAAGFKLVLVSNQAGVACGRFGLDALTTVTAHIRRLLSAISVPLLDAYYCPHHPDGIVEPFSVSCACRKPQAGLLWRASHEHGIDLARSWMVGDILDDVEAGHRAGCRTVLIDNGNETEWRLAFNRIPHFMVSNLQGVAEVICGSAAGLEAPDP